MFLGHYPAKLSNSIQLTLRPEWQTLVADGVYLIQGFDQNLIIMTPHAFRTVYEQLTGLNIADPLVRLFMRTFLSTTTAIPNVENATIRVPQFLLDYARLESNVVVVGQGEYVEVWSPENWQIQQEEIGRSDINASRFAAFEINLTENHTK